MLLKQRHVFPTIISIPRICQVFCHAQLVLALASPILIISTSLFLSLGVPNMVKCGLRCCVLLLESLLLESHLGKSLKNYQNEESVMFMLPAGLNY